MKNKTKNIKFGRVVLIVTAATVLLVVLTYFILVFNNENNARRTGEVMVNQVSGMLDKNRSVEETLLESLKDDYIIRAKTVAYMIEHNAAAEYDVNELKKIAELMSIDEIHLFNKTGTIYAGTEPKYYGYSFDSGEQISYFKPMLSNKTLSMCQDVMPNTAEGKSMMYAITWDSSGSRMIQVGIEPKRLINELNNNRIFKVVDSIPTYEDMEIYVANAQTGEILGSTDDKNGLKLQNIGIDYSSAKPNEITHLNTVVNGYVSECSVMVDDEYAICVVQVNTAVKKETVLSMLIVIFCLGIAAAALLIVINRSLIIKKEQMEQLNILTSMAGIYYSMHLIDLRKKTITEYAARNQVKEVVEKNKNLDAATAIHEVMRATMSNQYLEQGLEFTELSTLAERLRGRKVIFKDLLGRNVGWIRMSFISISTDSEGYPEKVICTTQIIDEEKRREERLIRESTTDKLTHCFNRRAYENDMHNYSDNHEEDFVFISIDVNGLKKVNDTMGHAAGDELLSGAARCMRRCFGDVGKVYRTGGDEFAIILFADDEKLAELKETFEKAVESWSGKMVKSISVSCGYVCAKEFPNKTAAEIAKIADERMYKTKSEYYSKMKSKIENPN
ncbi:MAG: GGDEF domain-containing protein [[Eubacterium] saphenum]|nr:GGDEF domain-containing protein [[Eubacterium] saphenum]